MKQLTLLAACFLSLSAFAVPTNGLSTQENKIMRYRCECNAKDIDYRSFYGWSKTSLSEAKDRAINACWRASENPGTCEINHNDRCSCN